MPIATILSLLNAGETDEPHYHERALDTTSENRTNSRNKNLFAHHHHPPEKGFGLPNRASSRVELSVSFSST